LVVNAAIKAVLLHFHEVSRWARETILDPKLSPAESFGKIKFFTKLTLVCFSIEDHFTSSALLHALSCDAIQKLSLSWRTFSEYESVRKMWKLSEVDAALIVIPPRSDSNRRSVYSEIQKSRFESLAKSGKIYLGAIHPLLFEIEDCGLLRPDLSDTLGQLDLSKSLDAFEKTKLFLQGVSYELIDKGVVDIMPSFVSALANGPFRVVSLLPLLSLHRQGWSLHSSISLSSSFSMSPDALIQIILQYESVSIRDSLISATGSLSTFLPRTTSFTPPMKHSISNALFVYESLLAQEKDDSKSTGSGNAYIPSSELNKSPETISTSRKIGIRASSAFSPEEVLAELT
jgi:hypothetical protein